MPKVNILDPTVGEGTVRPRIRLAPRVRDLRGKVVGLLDNRTPHSYMFLHLLGERLQKDYSISGFMEATKWKANVPFDEEVYDEFAKKCATVVEGICG